jgi:hypothetical protein
MNEPKDVGRSVGGRPRERLAFRATWDPSAFRVARARLGLTLSDVVTRLEERGLPAPRPHSVSRSWNQDGSEGPTSVAVLAALAEILETPASAFYTPQPQDPSDWTPVR